MILFHRGEMLNGLEDLKKLFDNLDPSAKDPLLTSQLYFQKGKAYAELGLYDQAVAALSQAIQKNPQHKEAYFERASAYFELGQFDLSLSDYLASEMRPTPLSTKEMISFSLGLTAGLVRGGAQAGIEFIPSLIGSFQGLGQGLWAFAQDPIHVSLEMVRATQACIDFITTHTPRETVCKLVPELQDLIGNWGQLNQEQRGKLAGLIIGKYGVEIFAGSSLAKGIKVYQDLKRANNLLTFEMMALSERNRAALKFEAARRVQARKTILEQANLEIHWGKQNKHIENHIHYEANKSILVHSDPQRLVRDFAGKGLKEGSRLPGSAGYKEIVDFGEYIGYHVVYDTGEKVATSWGKIHYSSKGIHIVPTLPRSFK